MIVLNDMCVKNVAYITLYGIGASVVNTELGWILHAH